MGNLLSEPKIQKDTTCQLGHGLVSAFSNMQGYRQNNEDDHAQLHQLVEGSAGSFFAVYDGHGGDRVAKWAAEYVHGYFVKDKAFPHDINTALRRGVLHADESLWDEIAPAGQQSDASAQHNGLCVGSTAVMMYMGDGHLWCANLGDSRAVLYRTNGKVEQLSFDHKPNNSEESTRIRNAGGFVSNNRVCGDLALSRALGDFRFKDRSTKAEDRMVSPVSDIIQTPCTPEDSAFIVMACDGVWDVMYNEQAVEFVVFMLQYTHDLARIAEDLIQLCLLRGSTDNITAGIIAFEVYMKALAANGPPNLAADLPAADDQGARDTWLKEVGDGRLLRGIPPPGGPATASAAAAQ